MKPAAPIKRCILCKKGLVCKNRLDVDACENCLDSALKHGLEALGVSNGVFLSLTGVWTHRDAERTIGHSLSQPVTSATESKPVKKKKAKPGTPFFSIRRRHERATMLATKRGHGGQVVTHQMQASRAPDKPIPEMMAYAAPLPPVFEKPKRQPGQIMAMSDD